jgi:hypothetical protein
VQGGHGAFQPPDRRGLQDGLPDRGPVRQAGILLQDADPETLLQGKGAVEFRGAEDDPEEAGLAGSVGADQGDPVPLLQGEGGVLEADLASVVLGEGEGGDQGHGRCGILIWNDRRQQ